MITMTRHANHLAPVPHRVAKTVCFYRFSTAYLCLCSTTILLLTTLGLKGGASCLG